MEFTAVLAALLRRWYVVLLGMVLTGGLAYLALAAVPPTYSAAGSVLLLPPGASLPDGSNPLLQLGGLEQPAALVVAYLAGDDARQAFGKKFPHATYDIVLDPLSRGPLILITVKDPDQQDVMAGLNSLLESLPAALIHLQDEVDAPRSARVTSVPLSVDTEPTTVRSATLRALIAAAGVGLVLTLVGGVSVDSLALRRRELRAAAAAAEATTAATAPAPAPAAEKAAADRDDAGTAVPAADDDTDEPPPPSEPASRDWPAGILGIETRDLGRAEDLDPADWPPRASGEPSLEGESRVAPRA